MDDDFTVVDAGDGARLVAMMRATDAWPAVRAARDWVLDLVAPTPDTRVVDVGCGPGTFGGLARARGAWTIDVDRSSVMLGATRAGDPGAPVLCADLARLPCATGAATLVHAERVLQWSADPAAALAELHRITAPSGWIAVTDTDWGTFRVGTTDPADPADGRAAAHWTAAARGWVPHAQLAAHLPAALTATGCRTVMARRHPVVVTSWDPDDGAHADGPPGLPLTSIAGGGAPADRDGLRADVARLAAAARAGGFTARLDLVTAVGRVTQKSVR